MRCADCGSAATEALCVDCARVAVAIVGSVERRLEMLGVLA